MKERANPQGKKGESYKKKREKKNCEPKRVIKKEIPPPKMDIAKT